MRKTIGMLAVTGILGFTVLGCENIDNPTGADLSSETLAKQTTNQGATVVTQTNKGKGGWNFITETGTPVAGELAEGPGTPPLRDGSAHFVLDDAADGMTLFNANPRFRGRRLDEISELTYYTYVEQAPSVQAVAFQINIDYDVTDDDDAWQGRLVFEPANNADQGAVVQDVWQHWDAINSGNGKWWATGLPGRNSFPIGNPKTISEILTEFPNAGIHGEFGAILLKAGSGWASFDGNVDALTIVINGAQLKYDFEAPKK